MTKQSTLPVSIQNNAPNVAVVLDAFFKSIQDKGLESLSVDYIAQTANLSPALFRQYYPTIGHIVTAFNRYVLEQMQDAISYDSQDSKRDIYFDLIMARLDALQAYRDGVLVFYKEIKKRPDLMLIQLRNMHESLQALLEAADDFYPSWQIPFKKTGLAALYTRVLHSWTKDDTADLSKTMASLDKSLDQAETWIGYATRKLSRDQE
jgi:AcrR family transcriptional regulator